MRHLTAILLCTLITCPTKAEEQAILIPQIGHNGPITSLAFSPDGTLLASGSPLKLWDNQTGQLRRVFPTAVYTVAFSPDGQFLITSTGDSIEFWQHATGRLARSFESQGSRIQHIAFSQDGKVLATAGINSIKLWSVPSGELLLNHTPSGEPNKIKFSRNGKRLFHSSRSHFWALDVETHDDSLLWSTPRYDFVRAFPNDGRKVIWTRFKDGALRLTETQLGGSTYKLSGPSGRFREVEYSQPGGLIADAKPDSGIDLWDVRRGKLLRTLRNQPGQIRCLRFSSDGSMLASGGVDGGLTVWDIATGNERYRIEAGNPPIRSLAFSPDGKTLAAGLGRGRSRPRSREAASVNVNLWDVRSGRLTGKIPGRGTPVISLFYSPDGTRLALGWGKGSIELWHPKNGHFIRSFLEGEAPKRLLGFIDNETLAIAVARPRDDALEFINTNSSEVLSSLKVYLNSRGFEATLSNDGKYFASGSRYPDLYSVETRTQLSGIHHEAAVNSMAFSPNEALLATGHDDGTIRFWDAPSGRHVRNLPQNESPAWQVLFSPDGNLFAAANKNGEVKLWNLKIDSSPRTLRSTALVNTMAFSTEGRILAIGGSDGSIEIWLRDGILLSTSYTLGDDEFLSYISTGHYSSSTGAEEALAWRSGTEILTDKTSVEVFRRPDLVADRLSMGIELGDELATSQEHYLQAEELRRNGHLAEARLLLEGVLKVRNEILGSRDPETLKTRLALGSLLLTLGEPEAAQRYVSASKGPTEVQAAHPSSPKKPTLQKYGKKYAVVIGVSDYAHLPSQEEVRNSSEHHLADLRFAHIDAKSFANFLEDSELSGGGWDIQLLTEELATARAVDRALTDTLVDANQRDLVFIFFSGHARSHPKRIGDVYLLTQDFDPHDPRSGFSYSLLLDLISDTKAEHSVTFIDACRSGTVGFSKGESQPLVGATDLINERIASIRDNHVIFASASGTQRSWEDAGLGLGVFTYFLIRGLRGGAPEHGDNRFVDLGELRQYVTKEVERYTLRTLNAQQRPNLLEKEGAPDESFPLAIRVVP